MVKRPWRTEFFEAFAAALASSPTPPTRILELGSGPGFLAEHLLRAFPDASYVALDFSAAMHALAAARLGDLTTRVQFVERSFKEADWTLSLGRFDAVVTLQAVHELRHKRHALALHAQVRTLLGLAGRYLVCDHVAGPADMANTDLYMTVAEQRAALEAAGFSDVRLVLLAGGLALHEAVQRTP